MVDLHVRVNTGTLGGRPNLAGHHIMGTVLFARRLRVIEALPREDQERLAHEHRAGSIAAILLSAAALDAGINEIFLDSIDIVGRRRPPHGGDDIVDRLAARWPDIERKPMIEKYIEVLTLGSAAGMTKNDSPRKEVEDLIVLRNALTHFRVGGRPGGSGDHGAIEHRLAGLFAENPLYAPVANPWFPDKCLGSGCARWAAEASIAFMEEFCSRLPVRNPFTNVRELLRFE